MIEDVGAQVVRLGWKCAMKPGSPVAAVDWSIVPYRFNTDWFVPSKPIDPPLQREDS